MTRGFTNWAEMDGMVWSQMRLMCLRYRLRTLAALISRFLDSWTTFSNVVPSLGPYASRMDMNHPPFPLHCPQGLSQYEGWRDEVHTSLTSIWDWCTVRRNRPDQATRNKVARATKVERSPEMNSCCNRHKVYQIGASFLGLACDLRSSDA